MKNKGRFIFGLVIFAALFFYLGERVLSNREFPSNL